MITFNFRNLNHKTFKTLRMTFRQYKSYKDFRIGLTQTEVYGNKEVHQFLNISEKEITLKFEGLFVGYMSDQWYQQGYFIYCYTTFKPLLI